MSNALLCNILWCLYYGVVITKSQLLYYCYVHRNTVSCILFNIYHLYQFVFVYVCTCIYVYFRLVVHIKKQVKL